ncbi:MAG: type II toxin-antitoxin system VapC family toxin [Deltaproteobacteria bacterium]|nr:type II toxin-antitoxin system VapC family toxin [Deltaproteobacteria bacterium]
MQKGKLKKRRKQRLFFVDASGWIALKLENDRHYSKADEIYKKLHDEKYRVVTTNLCVVEAIKCFQREKGHYLALAFANEILAFEKARLIDYIRVDKKLETRTVDFFKQHDDKDWDIVDCTSFVVMHDFGITKALSFDEHFKQAGFEVLT